MTAKAINKLRDVTIKNAKPKEKPYPISDGQSLYIEIMPNGGKYWRLRYRFAGKQKRIAFGVYPEVSIKEAREKATAARQQLRDGQDPADLKRQKKLQTHVNAASSFEVIAGEWLEKAKLHWSEGHTVRVERFVNKYLKPDLGKRPISEITPQELLAVLRKKESEGRHDTAHRVKQTAGQIFRYAVATGRAERDPSRDLDGALTKPKEKHLAAVTTPAEAKKLLIAIDAFEGSKVVEVALKLSPLLFVRPGELRHMEWQEIDLEEKLWSIPAEKMKLREPHLVPLSTQAVALIKEMVPHTGRYQYVFPNARGVSRPLSENGVRTALRTLGYTNEQMTPHGFRAMARTLLDEVLGYRIDWIEHQLAHAVKDTNGRAYNRTTHLEQRREMMQKWADYFDSLKNDDNVIVANFRHRA
ncbi:MAG: integrase arm-type DNA-binding domain-containing protein [Oleiphilaceae bacterium]|nr:integrase arm-type DNA-binding domain-containing protein [Oleiphilaceae bacterium]